MLTSDQIRAFHEDGYLVCSVQSQWNDLVEATTRLLSLYKPSDSHTVFKTGQQSHVGDDYFLSSGDTISYFLDQGSLVDGDLVVEPAKAINKIGHALHELDPTFKSFTSQGFIKDIARDLGYIDPILLQSMLIFKQPRIGGGVPPHQDSTFLYTQPLSALGFWFALQDATLENGCLWFAPGSHNTPVSTRFVRDGKGGTTFVPLPSHGESNHQASIPSKHNDESNDQEVEYVPVPIPAGSFVLIHGSVLHKSEANTSSKSRWAYAFHILESHESNYPSDNWYSGFNLGYNPLNECPLLICMIILKVCNVMAIMDGDLIFIVDDTLTNDHERRLK